jgi:hypothetical protein
MHILKKFEHFKKNYFQSFGFHANSNKRLVSWLNFRVSSIKRVLGPRLGHKELEPLSLTVQIGELTYDLAWFNFGL